MQFDRYGFPRGFRIHSNGDFSFESQRTRQNDQWKNQYDFSKFKFKSCVTCRNICPTVVCSLDCQKKLFHIIGILVLRVGIPNALIPDIILFARNRDHWDSANAAG